MNIDKIYFEFYENDKNISNNQINLINNLLDKEDINDLCIKYNVKNINELKNHQIIKIINQNLYISYFEISILKKYFKNDILSKLKEIFDKYNINYNINIKNNKNIDEILYKIKKKHLKYIYNKYPYLINLNHKYNLNYTYNDIPLKATNHYEYGYQIKNNNNKFYYIKFYNWACFDIDNDNFNNIDILLNNIISTSNNYIFALYKTNKGFHIHIMNKFIKYNSIEYELLSDILNNDIWYLNYTKIFGYKLRLSKKNNDDNIANFIKYYIPSSLKKINDYKCSYYKYIYDDLLNKIHK